MSEVLHIANVVSRQAEHVKVVKDEWQKIIAGLAQLDDTVVQVGWFDADAARIAFINDRGGNRGDNPPPRPVLGPGMDAGRADAIRAMSRGVNEILRGRGARSAARKAGEDAGAILEQAVRDAMDAVQPPNAPATVAGKHGYSAPLRGFSPDRIWQKLEHRVITRGEAESEPDDEG